MWTWPAGGRPVSNRRSHARADGGMLGHGRRRAGCLRRRLRRPGTLAAGAAARLLRRQRLHRARHVLRLRRREHDQRAAEPRAMPTPMPTLSLFRRTRRTWTAADRLSADRDADCVTGFCTDYEWSPMFSSYSEWGGKACLDARPAMPTARRCRGAARRRPRRPSRRRRCRRRCRRRGQPTARPRRRRLCRRLCRRSCRPSSSRPGSR